MTPGLTLEEQQAAAAFSRQAPGFDTLYGSDTIIGYKRERVRSHVKSFLSKGSHILELNAGTGEDAVYFAQQGYRVHATDLSAGMETILREKVATNKLEAAIRFERVSFHHLETLQEPGPYDLVFSNFAGLNCSSRLGEVLVSVDKLVKPGGHVTLVVLPRFCLWEFLLLFRGRIKTAFRRFSGKKGSRAHIDGVYFRCWYYSPSFIRKQLGSGYELVSLEGLCTIVPPSYIEHFAERHPRWYRWLVKMENRFRSAWPWRSIGDYYIITLRKKPV